MGDLLTHPGGGRQHHAVRKLALLRRSVVDTYFCNFSVFQSVPDIWAIDQLFPIMPIHRLDTPPDRRAVLADLTCDSDGKIHRFIGASEPSPFLRLHLPDDEPYILGIFMVGAYQEILGDLHNLFGDTHSIQVARSNNKRGYTIVDVDEGDIVEEVLFTCTTMPRPLHSSAQVELATDDGRMSLEEGAALMRTFGRALDDYTYLSR